MTVNATIATRVSTVHTTVRLEGITKDEFEAAFNGETEDDLDLDFMAQGSEVRLGDRVVGRVVVVDCPVSEQFIRSFHEE